MAPVHGPKVYPDKIMRVEYSGMGAFFVQVQYAKKKKGR
jgi:hypothetical protein